jgi:hypothetical protein
VEGLVAMPFDELKNMLILIRKYLPNIATVGEFAQITDIISKSTSELRQLYYLGLIGNYTPACEFERLFELKTLIEHLSIPTIIYSSIISSNTSMAVFLPKDKGEILKLLDCVISSADKYMILDFRN